MRSNEYISVYQAYLKYLELNLIKTQLIIIQNLKDVPNESILIWLVLGSQENNIGYIKKAFWFLMLDFSTHVIVAHISRQHNSIKHLHDHLIIAIPQQKHCLICC